WNFTTRQTRARTAENQESGKVHLTSGQINIPAASTAPHSDDTWHVYITQQRTGHNHTVSPSVYRSYPEVRLVLNDVVIDGVNLLRRGGANRRKQILEFILEHSNAETTMKDVHNLIARLEACARGSESVAKRVENYLREFSTKENFARVYTNSKKESQSIMLQERPD
ncbi:hypothetical protein JG688_00015989, partial [Phytophthora aleatoria]